jgi:putative ABC transport system permease protein
MERYTWRILRGQPLRLALTVGGVALCLILMFFLLAVYRGVADGSVEYVRSCPADLWVLQRNATNILRGSSMVSTVQASALRNFDGIAQVGSVLFLLSASGIGGKDGTLFITGFEPEIGLGGPPRLVAGVSVRRDDEIVLDGCYAAKYGFQVGDMIRVQDSRLKVVGLSGGTNAFVMQYAFVSLNLAQKLIGVPNLATCFLIRLRVGVWAPVMARRIRLDAPGVEVYDRETFLANNMAEMEAGFLPLLYTVAGIGVVVLTIILSLLLGVNILERRRDFAILKILGAPAAFQKKLIIAQAMFIALAASAVALAAYFPLVWMVEQFAPEVSTRTSVVQITMVTLMAGTMSLVAALMATRRLRRIYVLEACL